MCHSNRLKDRGRGQSLWYSPGLTAKSPGDTRHPPSMNQTPAKKPKLGYRLAQTIAQDIIAQGWQVGANLGRESELMNRYKVSRDPLREALRILEWQGIARPVPGPGGGLRVRKPAREAIVNLLRDYIQLSQIGLDDLMEASRTLNSLALELLAKTIDENGIAELERAVAAGKTLQDSLLAEAKHQIRVFALISDLTRHPTLNLFIQPINEILINRFDMTIPPSRETITRGKPSWVHMRDTVRALGRRDAAAAVSAMNRYLDHIDACLKEGDGIHASRDPVPFWVAQRKGGMAQELMYRLSADIYRLSPGDRIGLEPELIDRYQVSRSILREAIRMLEFVGLVEQRKGRVGGLFAACANPALVVAAVNIYMKHSGYHFLELQDSKQAIEEKATYLAALKLSADEELVLAELGRALRAADRETFIPHAAKLIYFIANSAKNPIISLYLESIMEASIYTPLDSATTDRLLQRVEDIKARLCRVADAVGSRDAQSAALAMVAYRRFITSLMAA